DDTHTWNMELAQVDPAWGMTPTLIGSPGFGQSDDRPYEERQRHPADYDAQSSQREIAVHALEHLASTDRGVLMLRKIVRDGIRAVAALSAIAFGSQHTDTAAAVEKAPGPPPLEPLVWPVVTKLPPGIRSFAGHTDTVPDIVGRIGTPPSLVIFTEGNHLMVLLSDDIVGA